LQQNTLPVDNTAQFGGPNRYGKIHIQRTVEDGQKKLKLEEEYQQIICFKNEA